jgi:ABC-type branched-subunit amino acid transport system substrate-binding protein
MPAPATSNTLKIGVIGPFNGGSSDFIDCGKHAAEGALMAQTVIAQPSN